MTLFSVIVPTRNRNPQLVKCLEALSKIRATGFEFEVVIVDDGSSTPARQVADEFASSLRLRVLRQQNAGPAKARNQGAMAAEGKFLAFTDDDCMPRPDWLEQFRIAFDRWGDCLLGGYVEVADERDLCGLASHMLGYQRFERYSQDPRQARDLATLNLAVSRAGFLTMGGFDETFPLPAYEDRDFCARWESSGELVRFAPEARIVHNHPMSMAGFLRQHVRFGRGAREFYQRNGRSARRRVSSSLWADYAEIIKGIGSAARGFDRLRLLGLLGLSQLAASYGYLAVGGSDAAKTGREHSMVAKKNGGSIVEHR